MQAYRRFPCASALRLLCALALGGAVASCSLLSDFSVQQCQVSADCDVTGGEVTSCDQGRCIPGCEDNGQCSARDSRFPICTRHQGECVSLLTPEDECYSAAGYDETAISGVTAQDLTFMGAFAPTLRSSSWLTLLLGTGEINASGGVLTGGSRRPLVTVLCQDSTSTLDAALDHLVHDLGARALVASLEDSQLRAALERPSTRGQALYLRDRKSVV